MSWKARLAIAGLLALVVVSLPAAQVVTNPRITGILGQFITVGTGTASATVCGTLTTSTTQAGTPASTDETDLWTYTLPANTLSADGRGVRITAWGSFAANANSKTIKLKFGPTAAVASTGSTYNDLRWKLEADVVQSGANQVSVGTFMVGQVSSASVGVNNTAGASEDASAAITIALTGQNGTASANDILFRGAIVECF